MVHMQMCSWEMWTFKIIYANLLLTPRFGVRPDQFHTMKPEGGVTFDLSVSIMDEGRQRRSFDVFGRSIHYR